MSNKGKFLDNNQSSLPRLNNKGPNNRIGGGTNGNSPIRMDEADSLLPSKRSFQQKIFKDNERRGRE